MAERRIEYMALDAIMPAVVNPKDHASAEITTSLQRFGYVEAITLDERTGRLVAGHGRVEQLLALNYADEKPPDGVKPGKNGVWLVPVQRGWASKDDDEAAAYLLASNQVGVLGGWHDDILIEALTALDDLSGTGFTMEEQDEAFRRALLPDELPAPYQADMIPASRLSALVTFLPDAEGRVRDVLEALDGFAEVRWSGER